jgi:hypothetical protein
LYKSGFLLQKSNQRKLRLKKEKVVDLQVGLATASQCKRNGIEKPSAFVILVTKM